MSQSLLKYFGPGRFLPGDTFTFLAATEGVRDYRLHLSVQPAISLKRAMPLSVIKIVIVQVAKGGSIRGRMTAHFSVIEHPSMRSGAVRKLVDPVYLRRSGKLARGAARLRLASASSNAGQHGGQAQGVVGVLRRPSITDEASVRQAK